MEGMNEQMDGVRNPNKNTQIQNNERTNVDCS